VAYTVTLATLCERVLQRGNLEGASAFIKPFELVDLVNGSIAEWVDEVRGTTWNGTYSRSSQRIATTNGTQRYALAGDFLSLLSVDISIAGGAPVISARAYQEEQRNAFRSTILGAWGLSNPIYYQVQGTDISFIPVPQGAYAVTINYVPTSPVLADPSDTIDSINGWEEFIVLDAAIKCLIKAGEAETVPILSQRLEQQRQRIRAMAPRRDHQFAERVHVVENSSSGWDDW
jgi:hypothetical protein